MLRVKYPVEVVAIVDGTIWVRHPDSYRATAMSGYKREPLKALAVTALCNDQDMEFEKWELKRYAALIELESRLVGQLSPVRAVRRLLRFLGGEFKYEE